MLLTSPEMPGPLLAHTMQHLLHLGHCTLLAGLESNWAVEQGDQIQWRTECSFLNFSMVSCTSQNSRF